MSDRRRIMFRYALGQQVCWISAIGTWRIVTRRWTERETLGPLMEYGLVSPTFPVVGVCWVAEADLAEVLKDENT